MKTQLDHESLSAEVSLLSLRDKLNEVNDLLNQVEYHSALNQSQLEEKLYKAQNIDINFGKKDV